MRSVYDAGKAGGYNDRGWIGYQKQQDGTWKNEVH
jgi:hypothetical protein